MKQYLNHLKYILEYGDRVPTRAVLRSTGKPVEALSVLGYQNRYDLREGFPAITTKKLFWKGIVAELLWFLAGDTKAKTLQDQGVRIWDGWADHNGNLGPVYGWSWRHWGAQPTSRPQPKPRLRDGLEATYRGIANGSGSTVHALGKTWEGMIARCYDPASPSYQYYGAVGVYVCDRWLEFAAFAEDAERLPGWTLKKGSPREYVLDKDGIGDGFVYDPARCQWISQSVNCRIKSRRLYTLRRIADGSEYTFTSVAEFCEEMNVPSSNISDLWTGNKDARVRNGFELVEVRDLDIGIDQIKNLLDGIEAVKKDPNASVGRRLIVTAWNPADVDRMGLPACHVLFQMSVRNGGLHCHMYQRSADMLLGVPFNIASYALLTHMVAQVTGLEAREFIHTFHDSHIYTNHLEQVYEQLSRDPLPLPKLRLNPDVKDLFAFRLEDIELVGYESHPPIKAEVAI